MRIAYRATVTWCARMILLLRSHSGENENENTTPGLPAPAFCIGSFLSDVAFKLRRPRIGCVTFARVFAVYGLPASQSAMNNTGPVNQSTFSKLNVLLLFVMTLGVLHIAYNIYVVVLLIQDIMDTMSDFYDLVLDMNLFYELGENRVNEQDLDYLYT
uniref:Uncharacterized protein n=2 Tax=Anopheles atroparvus TaxID=41427 RepID=A0A182JFX6_ANOAO